MKTFRNFTVNDKIFYCNRNEIEYKIGGVKEITQNRLICDFYDSEGRGNLKIENSSLDFSRLLDKYNNRSYNDYDIFIFSLESDAIRYCKANLLKELRGKIEKAKQAIKSVVEFRLANIDHLNNEWIESEIVKLERQERETL